jgi:hypothetical protein
MKRQVISVASMLLLFFFFLGWLYLMGKISLVGIFVLVISGVAFVSLSHFLYKRFWS